MEEIEPLVAPIAIGDTYQQQQETKPQENETFNPFLQSPADTEVMNSEVSEEEETSTLKSDDLTENEMPTNSKSEIDLHEEKTDRVLMRNIYNNVISSFVFLIYKVIIPFGEYVLTNSTLWIILKSTLEVLLEMLLYIILAICYVFLKFISQIENKTKPKKNEDEVTVKAS
ncbi:uncharacterized protein LOC123307807 [Coccinella septempunctata]|uniref:uncharacterized protein LOC123307807 n=1 Tax=Coccinella septempunctata TaxID=41139 RepID=UPI001D099CC5|nr:uncharacterized protein LOC123307807 [Coccinella septempunctata]XP_044746183.1 uncharacterized protein LOC123307807 [Coccinella septempunctata]